MQPKSFALFPVGKLLLKCPCWTHHHIFSREGLKPERTPSTLKLFELLLNNLQII
jgi:hypothetical protein